ncbi:MAG: threonine--tRNA ligase, partial [Actinobacteria bacterium]|nr:threonine--tRNA ligase [Actinomycetota bacterium]
DDGHIYVRPDQIESEIDALLGEVAEVYGWFDLPVEFVFSTKPAKALGDPRLWEQAERMIESALSRSGAKWRLNPGDGAFYAPKIDILVRDALGREWQTATIQVDLAMLPERFDLEYVDESGARVRPIAIH